MEAGTSNGGRCMRRLGMLIASLALFAAAHAAEPAATSPPPAPNPDATPTPGFELALVDLQGQKKVLGILPNSVFAPRLSPDGTKVAFEMVDDTVPAASRAQTRRLYVAEL